MESRIITYKDIIADMHTHSTFSGHAFSTIKENIDEAKSKGLRYIAITDHYYNDGTLLDKKNETNRITSLESRINYVESNIRIIGSAEFNLNQDIPYWDKFKDIQWRPIGLHNWFIDVENSYFEDLYQMFVLAAEKHNVFNHIERELHMVEHGKHGDKLTSEVRLFLESICILAKEKDIFLEVNESSLNTNKYGYNERLEYWLRFAKSNGNKICLGTDAHYCKEVGVFENSLRLLNKVNYPKELILNCNEDMIKEILKI